MKLTSRFLAVLAITLAIAGTCLAQTLRPPGMSQITRPMVPQITRPINITAATAQAQARANLLALHHLQHHLINNPFPYGARMMMPYGNSALTGAGYMSGYSSMPSNSGYMSSYPNSMSGYSSGGYGASMPSAGYDYSAGLPAQYGLSSGGSNVGAGAEGNTGLIVVSVPLALADVAFEGTKTKETGRTRLIRTPALVPNQLYTFTVQAYWTEGGVAQAMTRQVQVAAGQTVMVEFRKGE